MKSLMKHNAPGEPLEIVGRRAWDATLIVWLCACATQGAITAADRESCLVEGDEAVLLDAGRMLRVMLDRGWTPPLLAETLNLFVSDAMPLAVVMAQMAQGWQRRVARQDRT